jgi:uncharacterized membrane protein
MKAWNDQRMENTISVLLRTGVMLSALVVLLGGTCFLSRHGGEPTDYRQFHATTASYRSIRGVIQSISRSDCRAVIQLGLLLLILTPIARVAFSMIAFGLERDRTYVWLTSIVLVILLYSLIGEH